MAGMSPLANAVFWWLVDRHVPAEQDVTYEMLVPAFSRSRVPRRDELLGALRELDRLSLVSYSLNLEGISDVRITATDHQLKTLRSVFVVHGHDETLLAEVDAFLLRIGLHPVVLRVQPSSGRTIMEKIEAYSDVQYAICLLTPDDIGASKKTPDDLRSRARQNVILELGYFIGLLGRGRVCALYRGDLELPSDYHGVMYTGTDIPNFDWRFMLCKELADSGIPVATENLL